MSQPGVSERTKLLSRDNKPQYAFDSTASRYRRIKNFQCCLCAIFLGLVLGGIVVTVAISISRMDVDNSTIPENMTERPEGLGSPRLILMMSRWPKEDQVDDMTKFNNQTAWDEAMSFGKDQLVLKEDQDELVPSLPLDSPSYRHQKVVATSANGRRLARLGYQEEFATKHFYQNHTGSGTVATVCNELSQENHCQESILNCTQSKYRNYNGSCNNLDHPLYGVAYIPFRRALNPDYSDGISKPRMAKSGEPLPSARTVSLVVHRPYYRNDPKFTVMLAVWGQFLDHDITATALSQKSNGSSISCCDREAIKSPECFVVLLDDGDPFSKDNITCLEFVRSAPAPTCCLGARQQLNQVTAFIDGSLIYGIDNKTVNLLRSFQNGELKMFITESGRALLPFSEDAEDGCNRASQAQQGRYCFMTGDGRANENLHLTTMHLLWARQHNNLAQNLQKINPNWTDEIIFQEARRIVAAQIQHITYKEFLPILFGPQLMDKLELTPKVSGYFYGYQSNVNPSIANNFAAAAFRFAHTIIPGLMKLLANDTSSPEYIQLHKMLFDPFKLYQEDGLDNAIRGAMNTTIEAADPYFTNELKSHMFERAQPDRKQVRGLDLVSLNIQRGRDHGLPGYTKWRQFCGLSKPESFNDLSMIMDEDSLYNIKAIYRSVDDVDFYTGALSEHPLPDSIIGPSITCLLVDQFYRIKFGDRFWYELAGQPHSFNEKQLDEIRKTSLAGIICENSDNVDHAQERVMEGISEGNSDLPCHQIAKPDLAYWAQ